MSKFLTPISIIIAGVIIAAAVLVSGGNSSFSWPLNKVSTSDSKVNIPATLKPNPQATPLPSPTPTATIDLGTNAPLGNRQAKVQVVEFGDYQCPYCEQFFKLIEPQLKKDFVASGQVVLAFRDFIVIDNFVPNGHESKDAALAARCAGDQGQYWAYHDQLFQNQKGENQGAFTLANLQRLAQSLGLDSKNFNACLSSRKYDTAVQNDTNFAQARGINGTPTIFINGQFFNNWTNYPAIKNYIQSLLSGQK